MNQVHAIIDSKFPFFDMWYPNQTISDFVRLTFEEPAYEHCGSVRIRGNFIWYCWDYQQIISVHLPDSMSLEISSSR
jgi:hypothetical protein